MTLIPRSLHTFLCLLILLTCTLVPSSLLAQDKDPDQLPKLTENFSPFELTLGGAALIAGFALGVGDEFWFDTPPAGMGPPAEESIDARFTRWANDQPNPREKWFGGAPDLSGYILPTATTLVLTVGTIGSEINPNFFLPNYKHELTTFANGFGWGLFIVNSLKLTVGRPRPFAVSEDVERYDVSVFERTLSFPSGHSASAAATSTFLFHRISDHLVYNTFKDDSALKRWGLGYALPLTLATAATTTVMYSRVRDQRHWPSDTIVGALIGSTVMTIVYMMHFDKGEPRRRHDP